MCENEIPHTNAVNLTSLQHSEWTNCNHSQMGMMDVIMSLDQLVDESDPDVDFPNSFHAFQTAEGIRQAHPDKGTTTRRESEIHRERVHKHIRKSGKHLYLLFFCICNPPQTGSTWWV